MVDGKNWKELRELRKMAEHGLIPKEALLLLLGIGTTQVTAIGDKEAEDTVSNTPVGFVPV